MLTEHTGQIEKARSPFGKGIFSIARFLIIVSIIFLSLLSRPAAAADIVREPLHGYWVGWERGVYINTLFQNWYDAAVAQCGGADLIHPSTKPPVSAEGPPADLYCWFPDKIYYEYIGGAYWMDACTDWTQPYLHDPSRHCYEADEKPPCPCAKFGNPVIFSTQSKVQVEDDYMPVHRLGFSRFYNSSQATNQIDSMSYSWRHSYSRRLYVHQFASTQGFVFSEDYRLTANGWYPRTLAATNTQDYADVTKPDGYGYHFISADSGKTWSADVDVNARLVAIRSGTNGAISQWQLIDENSNTSIFSADGRFLEMRLFQGGGYTLSYSDASTAIDIAPKAGLLTGVMDNFGHALSLRYDAQSRIVKMIDAAANEYGYAYDAAGNLISVTYPDLSSRLYHYDEPAYSKNSTVDMYRGLLTGMSDVSPSGSVQRFSTYQYSARAPSSTEHAGGVEKYVFDYANHTVTEPLGNPLNVYLTTVLGRLVVTYQTQPSQTGSGVDQATTNYDAAGNIASVIGWNNSLTCFQYETPRNLETVRIEGAANTDSCNTLLQATTLAAPRRKTTTVWHPSLRLPVAIAMPLSREERVYDDAGNMLSRTSSTTSDPTGALGIAAVKVGASRVSTFTYDAYRHVLTATGPRTDVNDTTSYTYDASGNLTTVTNAIGQVTTYSGYDGSGHVGRVTEPNGEISDFNYSPRGWISSRVVTSQGAKTVTNYEYDGIGQLVKLTLPDKSTLVYTYDAAHRLINIGDSAGNSMHYTLDNAGNRIKEEVTGSGGNLARQTSRVFNTLGRLTQVTGAPQ